MTRILLLHPGAMGASIGAALVHAHHEVVWIAGGRSEATRRRADRAVLSAAETMRSGLAGAQVVISVCPPEAAVEVARNVVEAGFSGTYVDGNAVSPGTTRAIAEVVGDGFVDGGIIGPPAWQAGTTRFYLSGTRAGDVAALFRGTAVDARATAAGVGAASALKMCYAAYTKGSTALILAVRALAEHSGVTAELLQEWDISQPGLGERSAAAARGTGPKAWRFEGEMREIAETFAAASLPGDFHLGAADIYARMSDFKDQDPPDIYAVIAALLTHRD